MTVMAVIELKKQVVGSYDLHSGLVVQHLSLLSKVPGSIPSFAHFLLFSSFRESQS